MACRGETDALDATLWTARRRWLRGDREDSAARRRAVAVRAREGEVEPGRARECRGAREQEQKNKSQNNNAGLKLSQEPGKTTIPGA